MRELLSSLMGVWSTCKRSMLDGPDVPVLVAQRLEICRLQTELLHLQADASPAAPGGLARLNNLATALDSKEQELRQLRDELRGAREGLRREALCRSAASADQGRELIRLRREAGALRSDVVSMRLARATTSPISATAASAARSDVERLRRDLEARSGALTQTKAELQELTQRHRHIEAEARCECRLMEEGVARKAKEEWRVLEASEVELAGARAKVGVHASETRRLECALTCATQELKLALAEAQQAKQEHSTSGKALLAAKSEMHMLHGGLDLHKVELRQALVELDAERDSSREATRRHGAEMDVRDAEFQWALSEQRRLRVALEEHNAGLPVALGAAA